MGYVGNLMISLFIFLLLIAVYSYIEKMEENGCACSEHPNRAFIKKFTAFVLLFLVFIIIVPTSLVSEQFGTTIAGIFTFVKLIFYVICIVYFFMIIDYTRFLVNEKCKCSEDIRREFIMAGSVVEISLFLLILMTVIVLPILFSSASSVFTNMHKYEKEFSSVVKNPYKSMKKIPSRLKQSKAVLSDFSSSVKKSFRRKYK